jgi:DNA-directed RNA polymerase subunit E'/Rpb7
MSKNLTNPYINTTLTGRVYLKPNFLDNNIYIHMKNCLKNALEKKCSKYGYIHTIHKIVDYKDGLMVPEDLSGSVIYDIKYSALICIPQEHSTIICKITNIENNLFTAENGPILIVLKQYDINNEIFYTDTKNVVYVKGGKKLEIDDYVAIYIKNKRYFTGDTIIIGVGRLENICKQEDVDKYYNMPLIDDDQDNNNIDI